MPNTFVIAEVGSSHDGEYDKAIRLIDFAASAGAQAVKFQYAGDPARVAERMHDRAIAESVARYQWPASWLPKLAAFAHRHKLEFICTVDCPEDIAIIAPHVDRFKVASWGATDKAFIDALGYEKPRIVSTGLCADAEVRQLARWLTPRDAVLHCVSAYPCPRDQANLAAIRWLDRLLVGTVGYSDHTACVQTGSLAVAAGARMIEAHIRLADTPADNPDACVSLLPSEFLLYVVKIRQAEVLLGDGIKKIQPSEEKNRRLRYMQ